MNNWCRYFTIQLLVVALLGSVLVNSMSVCVSKPVLPVELAVADQHIDQLSPPNCHSVTATPLPLEGSSAAQCCDMDDCASQLCDGAVAAVTSIMPLVSPRSFSSDIHYQFLLHHIYPSTRIRPPIV